MGVLPKGGRGRTYYNVSKGVLKRKLDDGTIEEHGGYAGVITGVRTVEGTWEGEPTSKLELRMMDPATGEEAIVSGGCRGD